MGIFGFLKGKSPEEIELIGDGCSEAGAYGEAKIEYEKALDKALKKSLEKENLIQRLSEKITKTKESLAASHYKTAENLIETENYEEAEGLLKLALELTCDDLMKKKLAAKLDIIFRMQKKKVHFIVSHEDDEAPVSDINEDGSVENIDDYFSALCSTLPEDMHEKYCGYGESFKSGYVALNSGDFETAAEQLKKAMIENPSADSYIPVELSTALVHLRQFDEAQNLLTRYIADNPNETRGYQVLCEIYWEQSDYERAMDLLKTFPSDIKGNFPIEMLLGETLYLKGSYIEAMNIFSGLLSVFGFNEIPARSLAKTHEAMGELQKAKELYGKIINGCQTCGSRVDPFIKARFAELCFQSGDTSNNLLELYFSLVQEDPDNKFQYYERVFKIYEKVGNSGQARRYQAMAESVAP